MAVRDLEKLKMELEYLQAQIRKESSAKVRLGLWLRTYQILATIEKDVWH